MLGTGIGGDPGAAGLPIHPLPSHPIPLALSWDLSAGIMQPVAATGVGGAGDAGGAGAAWGSAAAGGAAGAGVSGCC